MITHHVSLIPLTLLLWLAASIVEATQPPDSLTAVYTEKSIELNWSPVPGATGYNIYSAPSRALLHSSPDRINAGPVRSGTRFHFIWQKRGGKHTRSVKGKRHIIGITALFEKEGTTVESGLSPTIDNFYYTGYEKITTPGDFRATLCSHQRVPYLPGPLLNNRAARVESFFDEPIRTFMAAIRDTIDFSVQGACVPISAIGVQLLNHYSIRAYRAQGLFINSFHSFIVCVVDSVEYILDFTADQFVPDVSPVLIPRDYCFLNRRGRLDTTGTPVYRINRLFDTGRLVADSSADLYRAILNTTLTRLGKSGDIAH